jgi:hypothetical protein
MNRLVDGERQKQYGDPVEFFRKVSAVWTERAIRTGGIINPKLACKFMQDFKELRLGFNLKPDSIEDFGGYLDIEDIVPEDLEMYETDAIRQYKEKMASQKLST